MFLFMFFVFFKLAFVLSQNPPIILTPNKNETLNVGLIFFPAAYILPINYVKAALDLQDAFPANLWISLPSFSNEYPYPDEVGELISKSFEGFKNAGFNYTKSTPVFFASHSLSGNVLQDYLLNTTIPSINFTGLINYGGFVTRYNRLKINQTNFVPVLTLGAELDGYCRLGRIAEAFYYDFYTNTTSANSYTIVVEGMNHYQFVGNGTPPFYLKIDDLDPEISNDNATETVNRIVTAFLKSSLCERFNDCSDERMLLANKQANSASLLDPLLNGFKLEGFSYMFKPCYAYPELNPPDCLLGSPWIEIAQEMLATSDIMPKLNITDTFYPFDRLPIGAPTMFSNCVKNSSCVINISTVTRTQYFYPYSPNQDASDQLPTAALELQAQMISRQAVIFAASGQKRDFNTTDTLSLCAQINQAAINWSLSAAPQRTLQRFQNFGIPLVPIDDYETKWPDVELFWLVNHLIYQSHVDPATNKTYVTISSATFREAIDSPFKEIQGLHYCKLLSPARALEWIYIDSLKKYPLEEY